MIIIPIKKAPSNPAQLGGSPKDESASDPSGSEAESEMEDDDFRSRALRFPRLPEPHWDSSIPTSNEDSPTDPPNNLTSPETENLQQIHTNEGTAQR